MTSLQPIRRRLKSVGRRRLLLDWLTAAARFSIQILALLLLLFAVDFGLRPHLAARSVIVAGALVCLVWRIYIIARPLRRRAEDAVDIALLLEKRQPFASAVVAGLQFERAHLAAWGSAQLAAQVTDDAADCAERLEYQPLLPTAGFRRQVFRAMCISAGVVSIAILFPVHAQMFAARVLLYEANYPTRTRIDEILINGQPLLATPQTAHVVEDTPLEFVVRAGGDLPDWGTIQLTSAIGEDATSLTITRDRTSPQSGQASYRASGPSLNENAIALVELGDARSAEIQIELVRRPMVELSIEATPPEYARTNAASEIRWERYVAFLEGSTITFRLRCTNGKQLRAATFHWSIDSDSGTDSFSQLESNAAEWQLASDDARWCVLAKATQFAIDVVDEDGLSMSQPLQGRLDVLPDQPPIASLWTEQHVVVPTARPILNYRASDDFGVVQLIFEMDRLRGGETSPVTRVELAANATGEPANPERVVGELPVDLRKMDLRAGDRLLVRLLVNDALGRWPRSRFAGEPVEIEIADEARVLKAILEADAAAERLLSEAIEEESVLQDGT